MFFAKTGVPLVESARNEETRKVSSMCLMSLLLLDKSY